VRLRRDHHLAQRLFVRDGYREQQGIAPTSSGQTLLSVHPLERRGQWRTPSNDRVVEELHHDVAIALGPLA